MTNQYYIPKSIKSSLITPIQYITPQSDSSLYNLSSNTQSIIKQFISKYQIISGRIQLTISPQKTDNTILIITVPCFIQSKMYAPTSEQLYGLQHLLTTSLGLPVEIRLIVLKAPYMDPTVLAKYLSDSLQTKGFFRSVMSIISKATRFNPEYEMEMPSHLVGLKIKLSGRLKTEKSRPRFTIQTLGRGTLLPSNDTVISIGSYTHFNKKGSYTIRVWIGQKLWTNSNVNLNT